jgi:hypothetical protein
LELLAGTEKTPLQVRLLAAVVVNGSLVAVPPQVEAPAVALITFGDPAKFRLKPSMLTS